MLGVTPVIGMGGKSMGGDIAVTAAGLESRIAVVAACIATPDWLKPGSIYQLSARTPSFRRNTSGITRSPISKLSALPGDLIPVQRRRPGRAGRRCNSIRSSAGRDLRGLSERLEVVIEASAEHQLTGTMWRNALAWFGRLL